MIYQHFQVAALGQRFVAYVLHTVLKAAGPQRSDFKAMDDKL